MLSPGPKRVGVPGRTARSGAPAARAGPALRTAVLSLSLVALLLGLTGAAMGQSRHFAYVEIEDVINPTIAGYLERAVEHAEESGAELIVVRLDTPGGFLSSTRDMVTALLEANVPSVVYVAPGGAHAGIGGHLHHGRGQLRRHGSRHQHRRGESCGLQAARSCPRPSRARQPRTPPRS